jgi:thioredoxin reductase (NADPH)
MTARAASDHEHAFPRLTAAEVDALRPRGTVRAVDAGTVLFAEGDRDFSFFVVLSGAVEIVDASRGALRTVAVHEPGEFTGDVDMVSGRAALITARVSRPGEVLALDAAALRRVVTELPELAELILTAFLTRRTLLIDGGFAGVKIIGSRFSPAAHALREFATRNAIPFTWLDLETDPDAEALLRTMGVPASATPVVIGRDARWVSNPSVVAFARYMGLEPRLDAGDVYDLIVVGAGPAGLAASVYAASEGLRTLTIDAAAAGGQAGTSSRIENYVGFPTGISGADLAGSALLQAQRFGAQFSVPRRVAALRSDHGDRVVVLEDGTELRARAVLVASGIEYTRLAVPRLREFEGAGVYYAATDMEARLCTGDAAVVIGGGNSAGQATVYLARHARQVHLVIRGADLGKSMSRYLVDRVERLENVTVHRGREIAALEGTRGLSGVRLRATQVRDASGDDAVGADESRIATRALFVFVGAVPHTEWLRGCLALDAKGFVLTGEALGPAALASDAWQAANRAPHFLETSLPGVFAAGDARSGSAKRVAAAVGEGSMAVSFVHAHLGAAV